MNNHTKKFQKFLEVVNGKLNLNFTDKENQEMQEAQTIYLTVEDYLKNFYDITIEELDLMIKEHYPEIII